MAAFVKSVEYLSTTFGDSELLVTNTINLTKGQDYTQCVPIPTTRTTTGGVISFNNHWIGLEMIDNGGTPAVDAHRHGEAGGGTVHECHVDIVVVEFGDNVTVQQGSASITGTLGFDTITSITQANAFAVASQVNTSSVVGTSAASAFIQTSFSADTQIIFERRSSADPDGTIYYYVVESDGTDFTTEYIEDDWFSSEAGPTNLTIASVTTTKAFCATSYETGSSNDDLEESAINVAITAATTLTWYRDNGGTLGTTGTLGCWIVKTSGTEFSVQRFADDLSASTTNDTTITEVGLAKAIAIPSSHLGIGAWSVDGTTDGANLQDRSNSIVFTTATNVRAQQEQAEASDGANSRFRFEVVEFELEPVPSLPVPSGLHRNTLLRM